MGTHLATPSLTGFAIRAITGSARGLPRRGLAPPCHVPKSVQSSTACWVARNARYLVNPLLIQRLRFGPGKVVLGPGAEAGLILPFCTGRTACLQGVQAAPEASSAHALGYDGKRPDQPSKPPAPPSRASPNATQASSPDPLLARDGTGPHLPMRERPNWRQAAR